MAQLCVWKAKPHKHTRPSAHIEATCVPHLPPSSLGALCGPVKLSCSLFPVLYYFSTFAHDDPLSENSSHSYHHLSTSLTRTAYCTHSSRSPYTELTLYYAAVMCCPLIPPHPTIHIQDHDTPPPHLRAGDVSCTSSVATACLLNE